VASIEFARLRSQPEHSPCTTLVEVFSDLALGWGVVMRIQGALLTFLLVSYGASALAGPEDYLGGGMPAMGHGAAHGGRPLFHELGEMDIAGLDGRIAYKSLKAVNDNTRLVFRGAKEASIYSALSPTVVLVLRNGGGGSGSLISTSGEILTNWHVVEGFSSVGVIFKPRMEGRNLKESDLIRAEVIKLDEVSDLALLKVRSVPSGIKPISLGDKSEINVGADVHAIGHPTGESWTYTKGFISQVRNKYRWQTESGVAHEANVIQTQTPINPGNSGGPLISDSGNLVGVNSFKAEGESLNFAVAVDEVRHFLDAKKSRYAKPQTDDSSPQCKAEVLFEGRNSEDTGQLIQGDLDCDGVVDAIQFTPDDKSEPIRVQYDVNGDSLSDVVVVDADTS